MDKREIMVHILCNAEKSIYNVFDHHRTGRIDTAARIADQIIAATPECDYPDTSLNHSTEMGGEYYIFDGYGNKK